MLSMRHIENYWALSPQDNNAFYLFQFFNKEMILDFMGQRFVFNPPHIESHARYNQHPQSQWIQC